MRERLVVPPAAAELLSRPALQTLLAALIERACTMSDLVKPCGMSYSLLSHHLRRLIELGLVHEVGRTPRAGRACRLFRAVARSYLLPAAWCKALPGEQLARELRSALGRAQSPQGLLLSSDGGPRVQLMQHQPRTDTSELWLRLQLSSAEASAFNGELRALFERWRGRASPRGRAFLVHGACVRAD